MRNNTKNSLHTFLSLWITALIFSGCNKLPLNTFWSYYGGSTPLSAKQIGITNAGVRLLSYYHEETYISLDSLLSHRNVQILHDTVLMVDSAFFILDKGPLPEVAIPTYEFGKNLRPHQLPFSIIGKRVSADSAVFYHNENPIHNFKNLPLSTHENNPTTINKLFLYLDRDLPMKYYDSLKTNFIFPYHYRKLFIAGKNKRNVFKAFYWFESITISEEPYYQKVKNSNITQNFNPIKYQTLLKDSICIAFNTDLFTPNSLDSLSDKRFAETHFIALYHDTTTVEKWSNTITELRLKNHVLRDKVSQLNFGLNYQQLTAKEQAMIRHMIPQKIHSINQKWIIHPD